MKVLDAERLEGLVQRVNALHAPGSLAGTLAIGEEILREIFGGDAAAVAQRAHAAALRQVAQHPALAMSSTCLWRALHIALQAEELPSDVRMHLGISHHRELLVVPDRARKAELARRSVREGWSAGQLRAEIQALRPARSRTRTRAAIARIPEQVRVAVERLAHEEGELLERLGPEGVRRLAADLIAQGDALRAAGERLVASARAGEADGPRSRRR